MKRFRQGNTFATKTHHLIRPEDYKARRYIKAKEITNPYTASGPSMDREGLYDLEETRWTGGDSGEADRRAETLISHGLLEGQLACTKCSTPLTWEQAEVDHKRARARFKRQRDAEYPENRRPLCKPCHREKTKRDRQVLSRVR
jgi:5-methylcytosine-specific restriction endonuclease McrA